MAGHHLHSRRLAPREPHAARPRRAAGTRRAPPS